ncbi:Cytosol non-specific dipeptidase [bioreactor metagenome]|uniref:Cytosol non-specific dipeptidase n=1 Tax=bioreactor metagenome TaxID=1076179 RepID=A0A644W090_9ZZZZ|nr:aminoacyl-histidine dipeptidase [Lentimicrobium sp.]MEA5112318.1 aminoacyl-histidine dipeptidase [Lentimicrobium sp.]
MNNPIQHLEPKAVWKNFFSLTQIPRPSKKEERIIEFMKNFGLSAGLETWVDEVGNVMIRKPATPGMENRKGIVLQAHLDMVPQKNSDKTHDFEKDPIEPQIDGEWVKANGTTLGADNGMGVAAIMAVLESKDLVHGPIEALFTIDEESGMTGAFNLQPDVLKGEILLNLDSEDEGELYIGCAGGINGNFEFPFKKAAAEQGTIAYKINVSGLKGGHSGLDIPLGRGNSCKIITRLLWHGVQKHRLRLSSLEAGNMRNAIPREGHATVTIPANEKEKFEKCMLSFAETIKAELSVTEPGLQITAASTAMPDYLMDADTQNRMLRAVYGCPNGVIRMSDTMEGLVETSTNLSIVKTEGETVKVTCLLRSSVNSAKTDLTHMMGSIFELAGAKVEFDGEYPGWKPNPDSAILKAMQDVYNTRFGKVPEIKAIHAGLECGLLGAVYPGWDMISFGPTIRYPHSPDEKVNIASVEKFWIYLTETLKNAPAKPVA